MDTNMEEVRKAARRVRDGAGCRIDVQLLAKCWLEELARRDAEQAERERPIDEEWLYSFGAEYRSTNWNEGVSHWVFSACDIYVSDEHRVAVVKLDGCRLGTFTTRGPCGDLLTALKGGAT